MRKEICKNCKWWDRNQFVDGTHGYCRNKEVLKMCIAEFKKAFLAPPPEFGCNHWEEVKDD